MIRANRYQTPGSLGMSRGILGRQGRCAVDCVRLVTIDDESFPLILERTRNGPAGHMPLDPHQEIVGFCDCALPHLGQDDLFRPATGHWVAKRDLNVQG